MTTLELAEKIAQAVIREHETVRYGVPPLAVLRVLHENDSWFVRNPTEERYEKVQPELFK